MSDLYVGVMSGTSLDGADAVLAEFSPPPAPDDSSAPFSAALPRILAHAHAPFPADLAERLLSLQSPAADELHRAALAANALADHYALLVSRLLHDARIVAARVAAIGAHGQTVRHRPELGYTLQLNAPARLAEASGIDVIADFRSRDVAAGGHGAPLVPAFHASVFADATRHRAIVNIGGMANITDLPPGQGASASVRGWDCGPGNVLLDGWIAEQRGFTFDSDGAWASGGTVVAPLFSALRAEPWFSIAPPKSTGRERFNLRWLQDRLATLPPLPPLAAVDVQATLAELTAWSIADSIARFAGDAREVIVCGGGAFNADLLARLRRMLDELLDGQSSGSITVSTSAECGIPVDQVEALAFACLARQFRLGLPGNLPAVTGAKGLRLLGALYPR